MRVQNIVSSKGNRVRNQFIIKDGKGNTYFQSYDTIIAKIDRFGKVTLDDARWKSSVTTSKYRNIFLNATSQEVEQRVKNKVYKLRRLNREYVPINYTAPYQG